MTTMESETLNETEILFVVMLSDHKTYDECLEVCRKHTRNRIELIANLQTIARVNPQIRQFHKKEMKKTDWNILSQMWVEKQKEIDGFPQVENRASI